jgi:transcriptional regulator with XRE-family HTH domain
MKEGALERLIKALEADGRDMKAISRAAGCGENYVQQLIKNRKEPGIERLSRLLTTLGSVSTLYVITGVEMSPQDEQLLTVASRLTADQKMAAIDFFRKLQETARS